MHKKEIMILIGVFISILLLSTCSTYFILKNNHKDTKETNNVLKLEKYSLNYGKYIGYETEYNNDTNKEEKKKLTITLSKDKINNESYNVKGSKLYVNGFDMYEVTGNNKFILLAGEGVEFTYEG